MHTSRRQCHDTGILGHNLTAGHLTCHLTQSDQNVSIVDNSSSCSSSSSHQWSVRTSVSADMRTMISCLLIMLSVALASQQCQRNNLHLRRHVPWYANARTVFAWHGKQSLKKVSETVSAVLGVAVWQWGCYSQAVTHQQRCFGKQDMRVVHELFDI